MSECHVRGGKCHKMVWVMQDNRAVASGTGQLASGTRQLSGAGQVTGQWVSDVSHQQQYSSYCFYCYCLSGSCGIICWHTARHTRHYHHCTSTLTYRYHWWTTKIYSFPHSKRNVMSLVTGLSTTLPALTGLVQSHKLKVCLEENVNSFFFPSHLPPDQTPSSKA